MCRIAVVSDTHVPRFAHRLPAALARVAAERPTGILHCGDFTSLDVVGVLETIAPVDGVAGNNDGPEVVARFGRRKIVTVGGVRIGLVHGDGSRGTTAGRARAAFADESVAVILFGHSHIPLCERSEERWLVNPGSSTDKRRQARFSFAVLDIAGGTVQAQLVFFDAVPAVPNRER
ncbi:MAG: metallophosphatase family protein [Candidatus Eremiobacteraeota bacterium]|nr:metallophosphatase family protein [Candidatus Eremiobacteraeota bacterium]